MKHEYDARIYQESVQRVFKFLKRSLDNAVFIDDTGHRVDKISKLVDTNGCKNTERTTKTITKR